MSAPPDISENEADDIVELAYELGLGKAEAVDAHHAYLRALARAAWEDGVVTDDERADVEAVAGLVGLGTDVANRLLDEARSAASAPPVLRVAAGGLRLHVGDVVVLTGTMDGGTREELAGAARAAGLRVTSAVSGRTAVVVAADPDSLSVKARDARARGIPIVGEAAFLRAVRALSGSPTEVGRRA